MCGTAWCECQPNRRRFMRWPKNRHFIWCPLGHELVGIHVWSEVNVIADALSRMGEHGLVPPELCQSRREFLKPRGPSEWTCLKCLKEAL